NETRFRMVERMDPDRFKQFSMQTQRYAEQRIAIYQHMASLRLAGNGSTGGSGSIENKSADKPEMAKGGA
ncbi:MAG: hypothetical protein K8E66_05535, partial [Phycisphaerales bacterium]|nr:hypothetical protein [Phycisphaerales bacterium]